MTSDDRSLEPDADDESLALFSELEVEPEIDLPTRVRRSIERRFLARDLISFYCTSFARVIMEWLSLAFSRPAEGQPPSKEEH